MILAENVINVYMFNVARMFWLGDINLFIANSYCYTTGAATAFGINVLMVLL